MGLPRWLSFLIVTLFMLIVAAVLGWLGVRKMKTVSPSPDKTIAEAQQTVEGIKAALAQPGHRRSRRRRPRGTARRQGDGNRPPRPQRNPGLHGQRPQPRRHGDRTPDPSRDA